MKVRLGVLSTLALMALLVPATTVATTGVLSVTITGATSPPASPLFFPLDNNTAMEVMAALPVVSTVTGTPASIAAALTMVAPFNACSSTACSGDLWAGQWTIVSAPTGIQAVSAYQGSSIRLVNTSGASSNLSLKCQVGNMTGSCIFIIRIQPTTDPLF